MRLGFRRGVQRRPSSSISSMCIHSLSIPSFETEQQTNDFISCLCNQKRFFEALHAFDSLLLPLCPLLRLRPSTYAHLLLGCSRLRSLRHTRLLHRHLFHSRNAAATQPDVVLHNHILNAYGKCGAVDDARHLFDQMPQRNLVSWASMISGYVQNRREADALELYLQMLCGGLSPDRFALGSVVRACSGFSDIELGRQLHVHVLKFYCRSDQIVQNALVTMYTKFNMIDDADMVFKKIAEKDVVSWGSIMAGFARQGRELEALQIFKEMLDVGVHQPNEFHFGSAFNACASMFQVEYGKQLHCLCIKFGLNGDEFSGCSLSDMYARCGRLESAKKAFDDIQMPDIVSWNSMISAFSSHGLANEAMSLVSKMRSLGMQPDDITLRSLLCAFTSYDFMHQGKLIHGYIVKLGWDMEIAVCNSLLMMYTRHPDLSIALDFFKSMKDLDIVSWNTTVNACLHHKQPEEVFRLLKLVHNLDNSLDHISLNALLNACADLAYLDMANQVHAYSIKAGLAEDMMVRNALIDAYAKCGSLEDARKLFELMSSKFDVFSWSSLIVGYAQFGYAKESLELFSCMQNLGIAPSHVTFVGVLNACSRFGLVDEGLHYYSIMEAEYNIAPTREHCSCVVDLLARAGRLAEAEAFMVKMPYEPDIVMWKTLLAACRMHNNMDIGKKAAESILKIDSKNSAAYILLCNIYASSGCWDNFARIRKMMKSDNVRKSPGRSWIKIKGEVSVFTVENWCHPQSRDIYLILEVLGLEMMEAGYAHKLSACMKIIKQPMIVASS